MTDSATDGSYSLAVPPNIYSLNAMDDAGMYASGFYSPAGFTYHAQAAGKIDVRGGDAASVDLRLPPAIHVAIEITNTDGQALVGIGCHLDLNSWDSVAQTNAMGICTFVVSPGRFYIWLAVAGEGDFYYTSSGYTVNATAATVLTVTDTSSDFSLNMAVPTGNP
jgi:hypothetical protein